MAYIMIPPLMDAFHLRSYLKLKITETALLIFCFAFARFL